MLVSKPDVALDPAVSGTDRWVIGYTDVRIWCLEACARWCASEVRPRFAGMHPSLDPGHGGAHEKLMLAERSFPSRLHYRSEADP